MEMTELIVEDMKSDIFEISEGVLRQSRLFRVVSAKSGQKEGICYKDNSVVVAGLLITEMVVWNILSSIKDVSYGCINDIVLVQ